MAPENKDTVRDLSLVVMAPINDILITVNQAVARAKGDGVALDALKRKRATHDVGGSERANGVNGVADEGCVVRGASDMADVVPTHEESKDSEVAISGENDVVGDAGYTSSEAQETGTAEMSSEDEISVDGTSSDDGSSGTDGTWVDLSLGQAADAPIEL